MTQCKQSNRRYRSIPDREAAKYKSGITTNNASDFVSGILRQARQNEARMKGMTVSEQAVWMNDLFESAHVIIGIWPEPHSPEKWSMRPVKGNLQEIAANPPNGGTVMMLSAVFVADRVDAEYLEGAYLNLEHNVGGDAVPSWDIWEGAILVRGVGAN